MNKDSLIKSRLTRAKIIGKLISFLPFVRCVILNGSLAIGNHKQSSDIDILIISQNSRIFSARFFVNLFAILSGIKRSKDESKDHAGKFCFNYFLTEQFLTIPIDRGEAMDSYCADNYSKSLFLAGDRNLFAKFLQANQKLFVKYGFSPLDYELQADADFVGQTGKSFLAVNFFWEDWFERTVKKYQIKKIESDPRTKQYPKLIVINDQELRFHPPKIK